MQSSYINILSRLVCSINYPINSHIVHEYYSTDVLNASEASILQKKYLSYARTPEGKLLNREDSCK